MNRWTIRKTVSLILAALLFLGCAQTAAAAEKKIKDCACFGLEQEHIPLFYVPSTLPASVSATDWISYLSIYQTVIWGDAEGTPDEYARSCEITLLSGDEAVRDALVFDTKENEDGSNFSSALKMDNEKLTQPGRAKVRIRVESDHFLLEKELLIQVASWEEHPGYAFRDGDHILRTTVGKTITNDMFANVLAVDRVVDAASELAEGEEHGTWSSSLHVMPADSTARDMMEEQRTDYISGYKVNKAGSCDMDVTLSHGNIEYKDTVHVVALPYELEGPRTMKPGETAVFAVKETAGGSGLTFTLSAEGEGISFDAETGTLTVPESVPSGTVITVTAAPDRGEAVSASVLVTSGCFQDLEFGTIEREGFRIPVPAGEDWETEEYGEGASQAYYTESRDGRFFWSAEFTLPGRTPLVSSDEEAEAEYDEEGMFTHEQTNIDSAYVTIDGHKARVWVFENYNGEQFYGHTAILRYARNNRVLYILMASMAGDGGTPENTPRISMDDMKRVAENTGYDEDKAPLTAADAQITVTEKNNATAVSAGKSLQFSAAFGNPDRINKANKNNDIFWTVLKADGAMCMDEAGITDKGQLIAGKTVTEPVELVVKAVSNTYRTSGEYRVTVIPEVTNISAEPGELFFYVGTDTEQTVQVRLEPESVPPVGLTWEARGKGIIEITDSGDGSAAIRPLKAGKDTVTVKEPGGKSAKINVTVGDPVTTAELSAKGKAKPGGTVTVAAKLTPANPANKNVEWSIDVGEDVATINEKGQLKIGKDAAAGTVITVTCTAPGAPEPITETLQITVE